MVGGHVEILRCSRGALRASVVRHGTPDSLLDACARKPLGFHKRSRQVAVGVCLLDMSLPRASRPPPTGYLARKERLPLRLHEAIGFRVLLHARIQPRVVAVLVERGELDCSKELLAWHTVFGASNGSRLGPTTRRTVGRNCRWARSARCRVLARVSVVATL